jgi:hypothetical protein
VVAVVVLCVVVARATHAGCFSRHRYSSTASRSASAISAAGRSLSANASRSWRCSSTASIIATSFPDTFDTNPNEVALFQFQLGANRRRNCNPAFVSDASGSDSLCCHVSGNEWGVVLYIVSACAHTS